ncbi:MAG: hypothetical protein C5B54_04025, partial [Acidobacteria bacterium]
LLDSDSQCRVYDESIGLHETLSNLARTSGRIRSLQQEWRSLQEREQQRQRDIDMLQFQIREIEEARISESEEQDLNARKLLLQNREKIHVLCESLLEQVLESDQSAIANIRQIQRSLTDLQKYDESLSKYATSLTGWQEELNDFARRIDALYRSLDFEDESLDEVETRLDLLQKLKRKYGPGLSDVLEHLEKSKKELDLLLHAEERESEIARSVAKEAHEYEILSSQIESRRQAAAGDFAKRMEVQLREVAMEKCRFRIAFNSDSSDTEDPMLKSYPSNGRQSLVFEIEPNPGEGFRELSRIASGGELSRLMLALKVVTQSGNGQCLIFDEIDAGISGRVAYRIGERLRSLSGQAQVLCVTHLPQVAAFGDQHFVVRKKANQDRTTTIVDRLDGRMRIEELARMLSGSEVTETALQHARELREQVEAAAG